MKLIGLLILVLYISLDALGAANESGTSHELRAPTISELLALDNLFEAVISPDGQSVAYTVLSPNYEADVFETSLWLADSESAHSRRLSSGAARISQISWSPDSKWISFVRTAGDDVEQIHALPLAGGESRILTKHEHSIGEYIWSPDGGEIAYVAEEPEKDTEQARENRYGDYIVVGKDYRPTQIWTIDAKHALDEPQDGQQRTFQAKRHATEIAWSPDGKRIVFVLAGDSTFEDEDKQDLYVLDLQNNKIDELVTLPGGDGSPVWAPDGDQIAFVNVVANGLSERHIKVVDVSNGEIRNAVEGFDEWGSLIRWTDDGLYFEAEQKTAVHLFRVKSPGSKAEVVSKPTNLVIGSVSFSAKGDRLAYVAALPNTRPELYVATVKGFDAKRMTNQNEAISQFSLGTREVISWPSEDGTTIEGILTKPADFDENSRYPLLCIIHGGPPAADTPALRLGGILGYPIDVWTNKGALVLQVNYRGSLGYGEEFRKLNRRNLGIGDSWDVLSGIDHLIDQGIVDPERLGCMGWSEGGFINAFFATTTDRFKALAVGAGISNWATQYYNTDVPLFDAYNMGGRPHEVPDIYRRTSGMTYLENAQTPTLIQHGLQDHNVPVANAFELRRGLKDVGVEVELVVFPEMGHVSFQPRRVRVIMQQHLDWFGHYIWGGPKPDFTRPFLPDADPAISE